MRFTDALIPEGGVNVKFIKMMALSITTSLAALSWIMTSAQIMSDTPTTAKGWELNVISAVIIGGTSLMGGSGRIWGTFIGVVFLGAIINGITLLNVSEYWQYVVTRSFDPGSHFIESDSDKEKTIVKNVFQMIN